MTMATRKVTFRDFMIFQLKLWLDRGKYLVVIFPSSYPIKAFAFN